MSEIKHSPLPYSMAYEGSGDFQLYDAERNEIAYASGPDSRFMGGQISEETASFIVRACNNHYKLVEALEKISMGTAWLTPDEMIEIAEKALAEAEAA